MSSYWRFFSIFLLLSALLGASFSVLAVDNVAAKKTSDIEIKTSSYLAKNDSLINNPLINSGNSKGVIASNKIEAGKITEKRSGRVGFSDFLVTFITLILVLFLILFVAWLVKRSGFMPGGNNQLIRLLASIPVGQKERVALIQVGEEQILIGVATGSVEKLHVLKSPVDVAQVSSSAQKNNLFELALKKYKQSVFRQPTVEQCEKNGVKKGVEKNVENAKK